MLLSALAIVLLSPGERPRDIWAFRSVLDKHARMLTLALHKDLWVAYDATNCGLYRAWEGGVKFDGAVYTTEHGPQPTSYGDIALRGIIDRPVWRLQRAGTDLPAHIEFKGYRLAGDQITLQYRFQDSGHEVWVYETPEVASESAGKVRFIRDFRVEGLRAGQRVGLRTMTPAGAEEDLWFPGNGTRHWEATFSVRGAAASSEETVAAVDQPSPMPESNVAAPVQQAPREPGVAMRLYWVEQDMSQVPRLLSGQTPNVSRIVPNVDFANYQAFGSPEADHFFVRMSGYLNVDREGEYAFRLTSDDGSRFTIRDEVIVDHDGLHDAIPKEGRFRLAPGEHPFEIEYFENGGGEVLRLEWRPPGAEAFTVVPASAFTTAAGEVRVTSPGKKAIFNPASRNRPGDGAPLAGVHPAYDLETVRPKDFRPRVGGMGFLPDGRLAVCTWDADGAVYLLDGVQEPKPHNIKVKRIATGLAEPLGLTVVGKDIYVLQKQELTRLRDLDGDDVIDEYYAVANGWGVTANFHEFAFGLVHHAGKFYGTLATAIDPGGHSSDVQNPDRGAIVEISPNGSYRIIARGLRTPNGIGFGAGGRIYVADNQGDWLPASKILAMKDGAFYGNRSVRPREDRNTPEFPPVVWLPQGEIGNSPSQIAPLDHGPYRGQQVHGDVTHGGLKRVFVEEVDGMLQGAAFRFTQGLEAGINRVVVGPDQAFYVGGIGSTGNWGQEGKERFGLQRLRYNGKVPFEPLAMRAFANGFEVELTKPLAAGLGTDPADYHLEQWRYVPTTEYGGPKVDPETLPVRSVTVSADRRRVFVESPGLRAGHLVYLRLGRPLMSESDEPLWTTEAWYTLNRIPQRVGKVNPVRRPLNRLTKDELAAGFEMLFDGVSLDKFRGRGREDAPKAWQSQNGELRLVPGGDGGDLETKELYRDFDLRLEWKISRGGNSGVIFRSEEQGAPWETGPEMQVLDDELHPDGRNRLTSAGSNYAMHPPKWDVARPAGMWNEARIVVKGNDVRFWLNGHNVVSYTLDSPEWRALKAKSKFAGYPRYGLAPTGHIVLQDHGDAVAYRNIRIKKL
jgi:cytochrome c